MNSATRAAIVTKSHLVTRDIDLLGEMAKENLAAVFVSITTLDPEVARQDGAARAGAGQRRLDALRQAQRCRAFPAA